MTNTATIRIYTGKWVLPVPVYDLAITAITETWGGGHTSDPDDEYVDPWRERPGRLFYSADAGGEAINYRMELRDGEDDLVVFEAWMALPDWVRQLYGHQSVSVSVEGPDAMELARELDARFSHSTEPTASVYAMFEETVIRWPAHVQRDREREANRRAALDIDEFPVGVWPGRDVQIASEGN